MLGLVDAVPSRTGGGEGRLGLGIGYRALPAEDGELPAAPFPNRLDQDGISVAHEVQERIAVGVLLAHEEERDVRREQKYSGRQTHTRRLDQRRQALPGGTVADLIVVLHADDEPVAGHVFRGMPVAPAPIGRIAAVVDVASAQHARYRTTPPKSA